MDSSRLPWVEKYRPKTLDDLISHKDILSTINKFVNEDRLPHLLLYGPPGTGKTSTILAVARQLYKPQEFNSMVLELNASDDRGIGIVREQILTFASTKTIFRSGFKLIILDEADAMTNDAQNALRRVIERFTDNARFCIICNYLSKIIPALQSRCTRFRFGPLQAEQILPRIDFIAQQEKINVTGSGKEALISLAGGDMRKVLNIMQTLCFSFMLSVLASLYTATSVLYALAATIFIVFVLVLFASQTKYDFTSKMSLLSIFSFIFIIFSFALIMYYIFVGPSKLLHMVYCAVGALLFSIYLVYDIQLIVGGKNRAYQLSPEEYITAAVFLYLDIVNLFLSMLGLLGEGDN